MSANSANYTRRANASGGARKRRSAPLSIWNVKGYISGVWMELRVKARNKDHATAQAHGRGMRVAEVAQVKNRKR